MAACFSTTAACFSTNGNGNRNGSNKSTHKHQPSPSLASSRVLPSSLRSSVSILLAAGGFVKSSLASLWFGQHHHWTAPMLAVNAFLQKTQIHQEFTTSLMDRRLLTNVRILATCQDYISGKAQPTKISMLQHRANQAATATHPTPSSTDVTKLRRFMKYATAAYGSTMIQAVNVESSTDNTSQASSMAVNSDSLALEQQAIADHVDVDVNDIIFLHDSSNDEHSKTVVLRHFVTVDHHHKSVVLAIRGTFSLQEILVDLAAFTRPFCGGEGHSEMITMAQTLWKVAGRAIIETLEKHPDYALVLTGHSLGGGTASLLHIWIQSALEQQQHQSSGESSTEMESTIPAFDPPLPLHLQPNNVRCYTYGGPPVFYSAYYHDEHEATVSSSNTETKPAKIRQPLTTMVQQTSTHIIHGYDVVPFLSVDSIRRLLLDLRTVNLFWKEKSAKDGYLELPWNWHVRQQMARGLVNIGCRITFARLLKELVDQPPAPPKEGAPALFVPSGCTVWLIPQDGPAKVKKDFIFQKREEQVEDLLVLTAKAYDPVLCDPIALAQSLDIYLHPKMGTDHLPSRYEVALGNTTGSTEPSRA